MCVCVCKHASNTQDNVFIGLSPVCRIQTLRALINEDVLNPHFCSCVSMFGNLPAELQWSRETVCFVSVTAGK